MNVTHHACATRVIIEKYTEHHSYNSTTKRTETSYSWDYFDNAKRVVPGTEFPELVEGRDYELGYGDCGKRNRVGRTEHYTWIGGTFWSERSSAWHEFRWLRLEKQARFREGEVQLVQSNYYGYPVKNGGRVDAPKAPPPAVTTFTLPSDLPPATTEMKALASFFNFFAILFKEHEYRSLLYIIAAIFGTLILLAVVVAPLRMPIIIYFVCFTVIALLVASAHAARSGASLADFARRRTGGGGGAGGRSYSR
jgi:hypothetical protein